MNKIIAKNPTAYHNYNINEKIEAGIVLSGTEIKSIRNGKVNLKDTYININNGEVFVYGMHISPYEFGNRNNLDPLRTRKLLMHRKQIDKLYDKGIVDIPTMIERDGTLEDVKVSVNMNKNQVEDYIENLKKELDIKYMDLGEYYFHDDKIDENYDTKTEVTKIRKSAVEFKIKKNEKPIRMIATKQYKNFLVKPEGKINLGLVTKIVPKKKQNK